MKSVYVGSVRDPHPHIMSLYQPEHAWFQWVENRSCMAEEDLVVEDAVKRAGVEEGEVDLR